MPRYYETTQDNAEQRELPAHDWELRNVPVSGSPFWRCTRCQRVELSIDRPAPGFCRGRER